MYAGLETKGECCSCTFSLNNLCLHDMCEWTTQWKHFMFLGPLHEHTLLSRINNGEILTLAIIKLQLASCFVYS